MSVFGIVVKSNEKKVTVFRRDSVIFCFGYERGNKDVDELWVRGQRHCWVPAVVNAAVPNIVNDFFPSLVNVFPESCRWCFPESSQCLHKSLSLSGVIDVSWGWCLSNAICMLENNTNAIRLKDIKSYHGIIIKADGAFIFRTSWLSQQESVVFFTP